MNEEVIQASFCYSARTSEPFSLPFNGARFMFKVDRLVGLFLNSTFFSEKLQPFLIGNGVAKSGLTNLSW